MTLGMPRRFTHGSGTHILYSFHDGPQTNSSPRSIVTPVGPNRLTLPPEHQQPVFNNQSPLHAGATIREPNGSGGDGRTPDRPGSSRFAQQYAYNPPQGQQNQAMRTPVLSHTQSAPLRQAVARQTAADHRTQAHIPTMQPPSAQPMSRNEPRIAGPRDDNRNNNARMQMLPPPTPQLQKSSDQRRGAFRPPATPQPFASSNASSQRFVPQTPSRGRQDAGDSVAVSNRFIPQQAGAGAQLHRSSTLISGTQRFAASSSFNGSDQDAGQGSSSRMFSRPVSTAVPGDSGQRMPFVPGSRAGFS
ncbi:hypothetical protein CERSUDRAFT_105138 [Gelatoporia subvermispora B]|uniref:Uncharacterized protein n=1 Tax=Ceriporiopsis subvermispora (strain B) TaxID=914234 RepID=M2RIC9_CERS8|nr:hypothetical protein CERSUDRAFT_105138 [Gelatoporia subvermispora B]